MLKTFLASTPSLSSLSGTCLLRETRKNGAGVTWSSPRSNSRVSHVSEGRMTTTTATGCYNIIEEVLPNPMLVVVAYPFDNLFFVSHGFFSKRRWRHERCLSTPEDKTKGKEEWHLLHSPFSCLVLYVLRISMAFKFQCFMLSTLACTTWQTVYVQYYYYCV